MTIPQHLLKRTKPKEKTSKKQVIDFFCGFGGVSEGIAQSDVAEVVACINHDPDAIYCHWQNHPHADHFNDAVQSVCEYELKRLYPFASIITWTAECTHFSIAKGGEPRDADSRMLNFELERFARVISPNYIFIENVKEFRTWGPLIHLNVKGNEKLTKRFSKKKYCTIDEDGFVYKNDKAYMVPDPAKKGVYYEQWVRKIKALGYNFDYRILNCADYGSRTIRKRFFGIFAKKGLPIKFPRPTHAQNPPEPTLLNPHPPKKWLPIGPMLDLEDVGDSIFFRKERYGKDPLSPNTIEKIRTGLNRFNPSPFGEYILEYPKDEPGPEVPRMETADYGEFIQHIIKYHSKGANVIPLDDPGATIATKDGMGLVSARLITKQWSGKNNSQSIDEPLHTITTVPRPGVINADLIMSYYGRDAVRSTEEPSPAITTQAREYLLKAFTLQHYSRGNAVKGSDEPLPTIVSQGNQYLGTPFILPFNFNNPPASIEDPLGTVVSKRDKYLGNVQVVQFIDYHYGGKYNEGTLNEPLWSITTIPKARLVSGLLVDWRIMDVCLRMLHVHELLAAQGFPKSYVVPDSATKAKKFIGNSVPPNVMELLIHCQFGSEEARTSGVREYNEN